MMRQGNFSGMYFMSGLLNRWSCRQRLLSFGGQKKSAGFDCLREITFDMSEKIGRIK
jgi:hypothetical protein